ncbi:proteasome-interacting protein cic1 [Entomophthora muscae]|uniref:Proteasome-interacting protein cic1 n=1 Tax=Entomophthora muscae TaxID=34485 RepID=A0ACC2TNU9_9FUNG|nr:proteasome-interacting protein cic1 [Entomophthora muscae]
MSVNEQQVATAVDALLSFVSKAKQSQNLIENTDDFFVIFAFKTIPDKYHPKFKILLPHSSYLESTEVCLLLPSENFEIEVMKREKRLPPQLAETITIPQLKATYNTFENKRMLASRYKLFLCEDRICNLIAPLLGRTFLSVRKCPQKVRVNSNFASNFDKCLKTARAYFNGGTVASTRVAAVGQEKSHVIANILATVRFIFKVYSSVPDLLHSILVKTTKSPALRIFARPESVPLGLPLEEIPEKYLAKHYSDDLCADSELRPTIKELVDNFDATKPFQLDVFGKKRFKKSQRTVQILLSKTKAPFDIISVATPAVPALEFSSTDLVLAPNPTKLLMKLKVDHAPMNHTNALLKVDKPKKVKRSKLKKSEELTDSKGDSKETDVAPPAGSSKKAPKKKTAPKASSLQSTSLAEFFALISGARGHLANLEQLNPMRATPTNVVEPATVNKKVASTAAKKSSETAKKDPEAATSKQEVGASAAEQVTIPTEKAQTSTVATSKKRGSNASEDSKQTAVENNAESEVAPIRVTRSRVSKASEKPTETSKAAPPAKKAKVVPSAPEKAKKSPAAKKATGSTSTGRVTRSKSSL